LNIYTIYIHDDRYSVPTLDIINASTDAEALAEATQRLQTSPHYSAIELWLGDSFLARVEADAAV
jgi:predicted RNase H-like HicB family nuclease